MSLNGCSEDSARFTEITISDSAFTRSGRPTTLGSVPCRCGMSVICENSGEFASHLLSQCTSVREHRSAIKRSMRFIIRPVPSATVQRIYISVAAIVCGPLHRLAAAASSAALRQYILSLKPAPVAFHGASRTEAFDYGRLPCES